MMFVPLRWRFFTGFNVLRSEREKQLDCYLYLMANVTAWIEEMTASIIEFATALISMSNAITDFELEIEQDGE